MKVQLIYLLVIAIMCSGCSVVMAARGSHPPDLSQIRSGATKAEVTAMLGAPDSTIPHERGSICAYTFETDNEPSAGRAVAHGAMDLLTLGIWEVVGTPIELLVSGESHVLIIEFDQDDRVISANRSAPTK